MGEKTGEEIQKLKEMAEKEEADEVRSRIYESLASYGPEAAGVLIELAEKEKDNNLRSWALKCLADANNKK